jgi:hypothetical protein
MTSRHVQKRPFFSRQSRYCDPHLNKGQQNVEALLSLLSTSSFAFKFKDSSSAHYYNECLTDATQHDQVIHQGETLQFYCNGEIAKRWFNVLSGGVEVTGKTGYSNKAPSPPATLIASIRFLTLKVTQQSHFLNVLLRRGRQRKPYIP